MTSVWRCRDATMQQRDAKIILKMINHKYWNQLLYPQWSRHCRRRGSARAQVLATTALCGLKAHSEIRYRSGPIRRWSRHPDKSRDTLITATGSHGGAQQPSSENGFGSWVWTFECPPDLAIGLHLYLWFITFKIIQLSLFITMQFGFAFNQLVIFRFIAEFAHYNHFMPF